MWKRLDESKLRNTGGSDRLDIVRRCYGENGKMFPRIAISVLKGSSSEGVMISKSIKRKPGAWWDEYFDFPIELLPEMANMLNEAYEGAVAQSGRASA